MTVLCVISARGGSQGVPGKNIRVLNGKPVIVWAIERAQQTAEIDRVVVSTDSAAIADISRRAGAEIPFMRPAELAEAHTGKFQVWQHALAACERHYNETYEIYVDLDCTNPLVTHGDVVGAIARFRERKPRGIDAIFTVAKARRNPYFNLVEPDRNGALKMSKSQGARVLARQLAPPVFEHVAGVYVLDPGYVRRASHLLEGHAEGYELREDQAFDIDTELDFVLIEFLLKRRAAASA